MSSNLADPFRITKGGDFRLKDFDPAYTRGVKSKKAAAARLQKDILRLRDLQERLYADDHWALLLIFQGMDASGKDSAIEHVMSGVNPQGCDVHSFKAPSTEDLDHDFMWRCARRLPERGRIGIFNRSYYEEVLIVRVHPEVLAHERIPPKLVSKKIWGERFEDICSFERYLARNGVAIRKFFMNVSREEQGRRFLSRLDLPEKNWKFSTVDAQEREHWNEYMHAYEQMIRNTSSKHAPWIVVPADHKWFARLVVAAAVVDALESLDPQFPVVSAGKKHELNSIRTALLEKSRK